MRGQLHLPTSVADLRQRMRHAWSTASDYEAALCTSPSEPELYEQRLLHQAHGIYIRIAFLLEVLELPALLAECRAGFESFRDANQVDLAVDELGNPYPRALEYLATYVSTLAAATSNDWQAVDDLPTLERILQGTPRLIADRAIEPCKESEVRNALYQTLIHVFPNTVRDVPIAKVSKTYKPDIGIRSLKAAVEFKFWALLNFGWVDLGSQRLKPLGHSGISPLHPSFRSVPVPTRPLRCRCRPCERGGRLGRKGGLGLPAFHRALLGSQTTHSKLRRAKFCDGGEELKRAIGGVFEDVAGYAGSEDWKHFYAVFYITDHFMTQAQAEADFSLSGVDWRWKPLLVYGRGARRRARPANKVS